MGRHDFWVRLTERPLWIRAAYPYTRRLFSDYCIGPTDMECQEFFKWYGKEEAFFATEEEMEREQEKMETICSKGYLEGLALHRKLLERLSLDGVVMFHCSALALDGRAYLFTAPSGTGKSTHASLWRKHFKERVVMINDDKPLLCIKDGRIVVYGSPYCGKEGLQTNTFATVAGIVVLHQDSENRIRPLDKKEAFSYLFEQSYCPKSAEGVHRMLDVLDCMLKLPVFLLGCTISDEAVIMAHDMLVGKDNSDGIFQV